MEQTGRSHAKLLMPVTSRQQNREIVKHLGRETFHSLISTF